MTGNKLIWAKEQTTKIITKKKILVLNKHWQIESISGANQKHIQHSTVQPLQGECERNKYRIAQLDGKIVTPSYWTTLYTNTLLLNINDFILYMDIYI